MFDRVVGLRAAPHAAVETAAALAAPAVHFITRRKRSAAQSVALELRRSLNSSARAVRDRDSAESAGRGEGP